MVQGCIIVSILDPFLYIRFTITRVYSTIIAQQIPCSVANKDILLGGQGIGLLLLLQCFLLLLLLLFFSVRFH